MTGKVLTPAEVAGRWCSSYAFNFVGHDANFYNAVHDLETLAISQMATIARLRGLIEGMECERGCKALWVTSSKTGKIRRRTYNAPGQCNCVKSQVNL